MDARYPKNSNCTLIEIWERNYKWVRKNLYNNGIYNHHQNGSSIVSPTELWGNICRLTKMTFFFFNYRNQLQCTRSPNEWCRYGTSSLMSINYGITCSFTCKRTRYILGARRSIQKVWFFKVLFHFCVFFPNENRRLFSIEFQVRTNSHITLWLLVHLHENVWLYQNTAQ